MDSGDPADQPPGQRGAVDPRGALYVVAANPAGAGEREERQGDRRAGADQRCRPRHRAGRHARGAEVARHVERVAAADEGDELDRLAGEQRAALRGVEGRPAVRALDAGEPARADGAAPSGAHRWMRPAGSSRLPVLRRPAPGCCGCWPCSKRRTRSTGCWAGRRPTRSPRRGGIAPEAKTDIATARKRRSRRAAS